MLPIDNYIKEPKNAIIAFLLHFGRWIPDKCYLTVLFRLMVGYRLNLNNPKTYNEKLQWLKLYYRKPEFTTMVDKVAVKYYVSGKIGEQYVIPTLGVWDRPEDIEWDKLPEQFVLKTTHGGGNTGVIICKDKRSFDRIKAISKLKVSLRQDIYRSLREWPYKDVPRKVLAEKFIEPDNAPNVSTGSLDGEMNNLEILPGNSSSSHSDGVSDYKFFCFDGEVKALFVATGRSSGDVRFDFYDAGFNHIDLVQAHPMSGIELPKPRNFEKMKELASRLSIGFPHVRIDMYDTGTRVFFGEMTFFHHGGLTPFHPEEWDYTFGEWIKLPGRS